MITTQRSTWPLFWCLKPSDRAQLMQFTWELDGTILELPPEPPTSAPKATVSENITTDEIDRFMRQKPRHMK